MVEELKISEVHKKYSIKDKKVKPKGGIVRVEGNLDRMVLNEYGRFAGYLYEPASSDSKKRKNCIRIFIPDTTWLKFDDMQFLLFKHMIVTGKVTVRPDKNPDDAYDTEELQIKLDPAYEESGIEIFGESTSAKRVIVRRDKHPHKRRELPSGPLSIAVISSKNSQGCNDFSCIIDAKAYNKLDYFYPDTFTAAKIEKEIDKIIEGKEYNCLCIVRGGGSSDNMKVFNDPKVVKSLEKARDTMYVVTGIGHSNDSTSCDEVADYCAYTPTDAAYFVNKVI